MYWLIVLGLEAQSVRWRGTVKVGWTQAPGLPCSSRLAILIFLGWRCTALISATIVMRHLPTVPPSLTLLTVLESSLLPEDFIHPHYSISTAQIEPHAEELGLFTI